MSIIFIVSFSRPFALSLLGQHLSNLVILLVVKLNITVFSKTAFLKELSLFPQDVLERNILVREDFKVIADKVTILATRTGDQCRAKVIGLFGDAMGRTV